MWVGVDGYGGCKAVCGGSIVTKISDIQQTHHTTPILMVINLTNSHGDYCQLVYDVQIGIIIFNSSGPVYNSMFWQKITIGHLRSRSCNYDGHIVSFLFTICNDFYNANMSISYTINHFMVLETEINIEKS